MNEIHEQSAQQQYKRPILIDSNQDADGTSNKSSLNNDSMLGN